MELIAHRGASRECRENTLPAFERALELGADGIELDVHMTADGVVIVHHDALPRTQAAPAGQGRKPFTALTAREVASLRFEDGSHIPTLAEVIDLVGDRAVLYVELKARTIEDKAIDTLRTTRARYALHSFDHAAIRRVRSIDPRIRTGILTSSYLLEPAQALRDTGALDYWQGSDLVDADLVSRVHDAGGRVIVWTVNRPDEAAALTELGVDGLCSDDLRVMRPSGAPS